MFLCGGYEAARVEHFILTIGYVLFFLIHIIQVIKTGWNNFQAMISGLEVIKQPKETITNEQA
jgi:thiosulfate reductase cytochrome b subunit